ncbi:methionine aminopeptidase [Exidia glandulosa HHB12029]|uniref:Methionine aminopeptidase n=1 Tax=Exidia glandulosa HHB12029 TaxID=1314781 RepID=A0A165JI18_EXIGL|nr:methionine aminopeptidase [Exidia glandulosa HHB12029]
MTQTCQSSSCLNGNPASTLQCPKCDKLGIKSYFCTQECFKASWAVHKAVHSKPDTVEEGTYNPFPSYRFSGTLRPAYPLSPRRQVPAHIPRPDYVATGRPTSESKPHARTIQVLDEEQQQRLRVACKMAREVLDLTAAHIRPGITTDELDAICHAAIIERNAYPSPLNYREYPKSFCTSVNEVICHGIPDQRKLVEGDIINLDVSLYYNGMHSDLNATYPVGKIDEESKKLIRTSRASLDAAIAICKPGTLVRDVGKAIEPVAKANGCSVVRAFVGHGTHIYFHCAPDIPHYAKNKGVGVMKAGMAFTIEPMINLGGNWEEIHWPDNWTATTIDGRRSAQFEETLLITEDGVEVLTAGAPLNLD